MQKLPKKYAPMLTTALMAVLMAFLMTAVVTALNFGGFPSNYLQLWLSAFVHVLPIVFVVILLIRPVVEQIVRAVVV